MLSYVDHLPILKPVKQAKMMYRHWQLQEPLQQPVQIIIKALHFLAYVQDHSA